MYVHGCISTYISRYIYTSVDICMYICIILVHLYLPQIILEYLKLIIYISPYLLNILSIIVIIISYCLKKPQSCFFLIKSVYQKKCFRRVVFIVSFAD